MDWKSVWEDVRKTYDQKALFFLLSGLALGMALGMAMLPNNFMCEKYMPTLQKYADCANSGGIPTYSCRAQFINGTPFNWTMATGPTIGGAGVG